MDGSNDARYGKTPLAWQLALRDETGIQSLDIPSQVVLDNQNPWNPFVNINAATRGIFFMPLADHLRAIEKP